MNKNTSDPVAQAVKLKADRHQPSKAELDESIHLPGESPEAVARIVMQSGAPRREPEKTDKDS